MTDARVPLTGAQQLGAQISVLVDLLEKASWINDVGHKARVALASVLTSSMHPLTDILQRLERLESRSSQDACPPETTAAGCGGTWDVNTGEVVRTYFFEGYASQWVKLDDVQQLLAAAVEVDHAYWCSPQSLTRVRSAMHALASARAKFEKFEEPT